MIATIDGHMVQGTPEEIAKLLGFTIKSSNSDYTTTTYIPSGNCPPGYDPNLCGDTDCRKCVEQFEKGRKEETQDDIN